MLKTTVTGKKGKEKPEDCAAKSLGCVLSLLIYRVQGRMDKGRSWEIKVWEMAQYRKWGVLIPLSPYYFLTSTDDSPRLSF